MKIIDAAVIVSVLIGCCLTIVIRESEYIWRLAFMGALIALIVCLILIYRECSESSNQQQNEQ